MDNIVAIATANGFAGVGIIRISGHNLIATIAPITKKNNFKPRYASFCNFYNQNDEIIDSGLVLYFPAPHSFTGEEVIELQTHGSPLALQLLLARIFSLGVRHARAGEFSERAFLNGKIDLIQAESIIDLIHAQSESAIISANKSLTGTFSRYIDKISTRLINLRMFVEASLDFPEEDIEFIQNAKIKEKLTLLQQEIAQLLANTKQGVLLNNGANIVIVGEPNVGKSSLMNTLASLDVAIVTEIAGTTRDTLKEKIIIDGIVFNIIDTAGIRETQDKIEQIGIERTKNAIKNADLCLVLNDAKEQEWNENNNGNSANANSINGDNGNSNDGNHDNDKNVFDDYNDNSINDNEYNDNVSDILQLIAPNTPIIFIHNKIDLLPNHHPCIKHIKQPNNHSSPHIYLSAKYGLGIDLLKKTIMRTIGFDNNNHDVFSARTRHLDAMKKAVLHIDNAFYHWVNLELLAEELRYAHLALSSITGEYTADDLLGEIFSKFCIGK